MKALFQTEFHKMLHSRCLIGLIFFNIIFLFILIGRKEDPSHMIQYLAGSDYFETTSVFIGFYGMVIAHEYVAGYFKEVVCAGHLRWKVYMVRSAAFLLGSMMIFLLPSLFAFLFFLLREGNLLFVLQMKYYRMGLIFLVLYCVCISAFFMMVTMIAKTYAGVVFICIFYNMLMILIHEIIPADILPEWIGYIFVGMRQEIFFQEMEIRKAVLIIFLLLVQGLCLTGIGMFYFTKKELC